MNMETLVGKITGKMKLMEDPKACATAEAMGLLELRLGDQAKALNTVSYTKLSSFGLVV